MQHQAHFVVLFFISVSNPMLGDLFQTGGQNFKELSFFFLMDV